MTKIIIANEKDEIIGLKERDKPGIEGYRRISGLWLTNSKGEILLAQRSFNKKHNPGKWGLSASGTVEEGETYDSNLVKEAKEEIGLENFKYTKGTKIKIDKNIPMFFQFYLATIDKSIKDFKIKKDEVEQVKWFDIASLKQDIEKHPENYTITVSEGLKMFKDF